MSNAPDTGSLDELYGVVAAATVDDEWIGHDPRTIGAFDPDALAERFASAASAFAVDDEAASDMLIAAAAVVLGRHHDRAGVVAALRRMVDIAATSLIDQPTGAVQ